MYEDALNVYERDDIAFIASCVGKCTWTYGEFYDAAVADVVSENMSKTTARRCSFLNKYWVNKYEI